MTNAAISKPLTPGVQNTDVIRASIVIAGIALLTLAGAWFFQLALGLVPCPLCLEQRYAYYFAIPLSASIAKAAWRGVNGRLLEAGLLVLALAMLANAGLGAYHAGVEWGFWQGPTACSGPMLDLGTGSLLDSIQTAKVIPCDQVQWRFLGLSLAGYNALISLAMAVIAGRAAILSFQSR